MEAFRVNGRTFRFYDEDRGHAVAGLPDQFHWSDWPRHILHVESDNGFLIRVRIDHKLRYWEKQETGLRGWKARAYSRWFPFVPNSWKAELEYARDVPFMFGPMLVLGAGFVSPKSTVPPNTVLRIRPRITFFPNGTLDAVAVSRLVQWVFSDGFRMKPYYHYDPVSGQANRCSGIDGSKDSATEG